MVGDLWKSCPYFGKNLIFNEIAELMYQTDLKSVPLLDFQSCEITSVLNV